MQRYLFCSVPYCPSAKNSTAIFLIAYVIFLYNYLELACLEKQNGGQSFKIGARIAELWQFKARKVKKLQKDHSAIFKLGLRQTGFLNIVKNGTIFTRNYVMVSEMVVKRFS